MQTTLTILLIYSAINVGDEYEARLQAAKQKQHDRDRDLVTIDSPLIHCTNDANSFNANQNILLSRQTATIHHELAKAELEKHYIRRHNLREEFRDCWLRATCDQMFLTLPREIRDMVYADVMDGAYMEQEEVGSPSDPGGIGWIMEHRDKGCDYHCYDEKLVGPNVFREIIQTWYRSAYLEEPLTTEGDLEDFLARDKWGLGVRPLDYLRAVELDIHETDFTDSTLQENLSSLSRLKKGARLYVNLECKTNAELLEEERYEWDSLSQPECWRAPCYEVKFYSRKHVDILAFFEDLQPLVLIFRQIVDAGILLDVSFKTETCKPIVVNFFKHGRDMSLDREDWLDLVVEQKRVNANKVHV